MRASLGVAFVCSVLAGTPALAVDLVNADTRPHRLEVVEWGEAHAFTIGPGVTLSDVCLVCVVRVVDGPGTSAEENDIVVIREGVPRVGG
ncbi:MAG: hypothetical protein VR70_02205 [Rhodospirillaceae bacterium BRH_c57]|nr:MAG: hypothetical protein VR70_02205 [Rhodospirillaceae bacterium BRH_c57]